VPKQPPFSIEPTTGPHQRQYSGRNFKQLYLPVTSSKGYSKVMLSVVKLTQLALSKSSFKSKYDYYTENNRCLGKSSK
jgi:hypothetical protein